VERVSNDYGHDLMLHTYDTNGEVESGKIPMQIKASDAPYVLKDGRTISVDISRSHIVAWLFEILPMILVIYDAAEDKAYWVYVQRYFSNLPDFNILRSEKTIAVHIPKSNVLDPNAVKLFAGFRNRINKQIEGSVDHNE
jgi:hypothetical protein